MYHNIDFNLQNLELHTCICTCTTIVAPPVAPFYKRRRYRVLLHTIFEIFVPYSYDADAAPLVGNTIPYNGNYFGSVIKLRYESTLSHEPVDHCLLNNYPGFERYSCLFATILNSKSNKNKFCPFAPPAAHQWSSFAFRKLRYPNEIRIKIYSE